MTTEEALDVLDTAVDHQYDHFGSESNLEQGKGALALMRLELRVGRAWRYLVMNGYNLIPGPYMAGGQRLALLASGGAKGRPGDRTGYGSSFDEAALAVALQLGFEEPEP